ncbi:MAG: cbb3-type cytochrome c oxidase subunit I [bacterium]
MSDVRTGLVDEKLVRWHFLAGFAWLAVSVLAGLAFSLQFLGLYPAPGTEWLSPGRVRMVHTNLVAYGWIVNAFVGGMCYVVPKLTDFPLFSRRLSWFIFWAWQAIITLTLGGLLGGYAQGVEWTETPLFVDPLIVLGVVLLIVNLGAPILRAREKPYYVSIWYFVAALIWTALNYLMGNYLPQYVVPGTGGAAITSAFIHNLVGLLVTPVGWGLLYYFAVAELRVPIYSHALSLVGFWSLAFFYPLNTVHHYLYSPIPMFVQYAAIVASVGIHVVVYTVAYNFFATLRGHGARLLDSLPTRWFFLGIVNYLFTCIQCAVQVTLTAQQIIHFSDWVVGHAHLVMFGVFGFWILGFMAYLWPKMYRRPMPWGLHSAAWWLCAIGNIVMWVDLLAAGLVQGFLWRLPEVSWMQSVTASHPFWLVRTITGVGIGAGLICFILAILATARGGRAPRPGVEPA